MLLELVKAVCVAPTPTGVGEGSVCCSYPPRLVFVVFFILNLFLWGAGSSAAIPFTTLLALLCLWFGISLPLTFFGAFLGFRRPVSLPVVVCHSHCRHPRPFIPLFPPTAVTPVPSSLCRLPNSLCAPTRSPEKSPSRTGYLTRCPAR